jgi:hypothetical protein
MNQNEHLKSTLGVYDDLIPVHELLAVLEDLDLL